MSPIHGTNASQSLQYNRERKCSYVDWFMSRIAETKARLWTGITWMITITYLQSDYFESGLLGFW